MSAQSPILARRPSQPKPSGWRNELRQAFRDPAALLAALKLDPEALGWEPGARFPMLVPRAFAARMAPGRPDDPLLRQVLPVGAERLAVEGFVSDPVGDGDSRAGRGLLHKYAGRVLLITTGACAVHCRYCFRQEFPYASEQGAAERWRTALDYIARRDDIEEVILSGGDPLMLDTARLAELSDGLARIGHLRRLRIHTRLPVVLPSRVTAQLCAWLAGLPWPVVVVIHANHAAEFDPNVDQALAMMRAAGAHLLNQSVLLAGVNDSAERLNALMQRSLAAGVLPYYLHLLDRVSGAARFEVSEPLALELHEQLRRELSGYLVPRLVREQAGADYKLPVL